MLNSSQEYKEQLVNELIRLTSVASVPVISRTLTVPPTSQVTPDSYYIVPSGATGAWAGKTNQIAYPIIGVNGQPNGDWGFWSPFPGVKVSLVSGSDLFFTGTVWQIITGTATGGDMLVAVYGGSDTGIVAKADEIAGNPSNDTFYGKESGNKGFFEFFPKVLTTVLTALNTTTEGAITATDNILQAFGKLQNQVNNINLNLPEGVLTTVLTGLSTATGGVITATDNILQAFGKLQNQINNISNVINDGDKGDIIVSNSGATWTVETGTTPNSIIRLDNTAKLPAVDGSQLTNLPTGGNSLTAEEIRDSLTTLTGDNRLDAVAIKNLSAQSLTTVLTGLSTITGGAITATDNILQAFGKLQNQINNISLSGDVLTTVLTGLSTATGGVITATDNILQAFGKLQNQVRNASIFGLFESPRIGEWMIEYVSVKAYNITSISLKTDSGTATVSIRINGIDVPGLSNLSVTSTRLTAAASGSNTASIGSEVKIFISNISDPVNLDFSLSIQYA